MAAITLRDDVPSPLAPRNDEEEIEDDEDGDSVEIDLDGFENRLVVLPPDAGNYGTLAAVSGKVIYLRGARTGSTDSDSPIVFWDLEDREEKTIVDDADGFGVSADGRKLIVATSRRIGIADIAPGQQPEMLDTSGL